MVNALLHPGRGQLVAALLLFVVGVGGVMQIRINRADDAYTTARREDLVQLLDGLTTEQRRLDAEIAQLQATRDSLRSGADSRSVARAEASRRIDALSILAGTAPATGPGIRMTISDPEHKLVGQPDLLVDAIQELRDAGAEAIELNDSVRVVASSWVQTSGSALVVDHHPLTAPIVLEAIGDPHSLAEAAQFRGGLVSEISGPQVGGTVTIAELNKISIASLHAVQPSQYAQPASPPPTPR